jgi:outer membrane immunogenic protein
MNDAADWETKRGSLMTKVLLATTMLAGLLSAGAAQAADMPLKAPPRAAPYMSDWTGFYIFGFGGYSWGKISPNDIDLDPFHNPKPKGGVFGFGGGYNWQYGGWVGGVEVDYGFSHEKDNQSISIRGCDMVSRLSIDCDGSVGLNSKIDALGSARVRVGYLFTPNLLAYGTAGLGWGRAKISVNLCEGSECLELLNSKTNVFGWVAGGGLEWKVPGFDHVRIRGEYLHYDFGSTSFAFQPIITINNKVTDDVARGALIFSFN